HTLRLAPYPFDESPRTFPISARLLPDRRYRSTADFLETYERAERVEVPFRAVA
ncbi:MAG: hypothetical protein HY691_03455, partial [Chloroflexi bacterium]|nr:hypothetical protein [Chloroflexota bacterium]